MKLSLIIGLIALLILVSGCTTGEGFGSISSGPASSGTSPVNTAPTSPDPLNIIPVESENIITQSPSLNEFLNANLGTVDTSTDLSDEKISELEVSLTQAGVSGFSLSAASDASHNHQQRLLPLPFLTLPPER